MATLTGQTVKGSYKDLLQVSNSNSGIDATARAVSDGEATASLLYLSTTEVYSPGIAGTSNTVFGKAAGAAIDADTNYNSLFGENAGNALNSGDSNVLIGKGAGLAMPAGGSSVIIGADAGDATLDSNYHVLIGKAAGGNGDIANDGMIAIGTSALNALTSGAKNIAIWISSIVT